MATTMMTADSYYPKDDDGVESLQLVQDLETHIDRDLTGVEFDDVTGYLENEPISTDPQYLKELFDL